MAVGLIDLYEPAQLVRMKRIKSGYKNFFIFTVWRRVGDKLIYEFTGRQQKFRAPGVTGPQVFSMSGITSISKSSSSSCSTGLIMPALVEVESSILTSSLSVA